MKKEVSIVLSRERQNYRKLAQEWFGLTDEQMKDCDVHHNPPRSQGGRNIPEHLFVYHYTLHAAVHEAFFILTQRKAAVKGGNTVKERKIGIFALTSKQNHEKSKKAAQTSKEKGVGCVSASPEQKSEWMKRRTSESFSRSARTKFEDPDHPELGQTNAGNLVRMQKRRGLPHGKENRRRVQ